MMMTTGRRGNGPRDWIVVVMMTTTDFSRREIAPGGLIHYVVAIVTFLFRVGKGTTDTKHGKVGLLFIGG